MKLSLDETITIFHRIRVCAASLSYQYKKTNFFNEENQNMKFVIYVIMALQTEYENPSAKF